MSSQVARLAAPLAGQAESLVFIPFFSSPIKKEKI